MFASILERTRRQAPQPVQMMKPRKTSQIVKEQSSDDTFFLPIDQVFERLIESDRLQSI